MWSVDFEFDLGLMRFFVCDEKGFTSLILYDSVAFEKLWVKLLPFWTWRLKDDNFLRCFDNIYYTVKLLTSKINGRLGYR